MPRKNLSWSTFSNPSGHGRNCISDRLLTRAVLYFCSSKFEIPDSEHQFPKIVRWEHSLGVTFESDAVYALRNCNLLRKTFPPAIDRQMLAEKLAFDREISSVI